VFVTGLGFGAPQQQLQLLIDTGSGITHIAGTGCGSSCGVGLAEDRGYNASASSTAARVGCGASCSCPSCMCQTMGVEEPYCAYRQQYGGWQGWVLRAPLRRGTPLVPRSPTPPHPPAPAAADSSSSAGSWWTDALELQGNSFNVMFGVQERQTGRIAGMGIQGLLALDRSQNSFVGQVGGGRRGGAEGRAGSMLSRVC
jgi:hypothetical protein